MFKYLKYVTLLLFSFTVKLSMATHIFSGDISYEYIRVLPNGSYQYKVTISLLRDALNSNISFPAEIQMGIYLDNDNKERYNIETMLLTVEKEIEPPCFKLDNTINVKWMKGIYQRIITLEPSDQFYILSFKQCCRPPITNIAQPDNIPSQGIGLTTRLKTSAENTTPQTPLPRFLYTNTRMNWNLNSIDPNQDSVVYSISTPLQGGSPMNPNAFPEAELNNVPVIYTDGYTADKPFGTDVDYEIQNNVLSIGEISNSGVYQLAFEVEEYRNSKLIASNLVDITVSVINSANSLSNVPYALQAIRLNDLNVGLSWQNCRNDVENYEIFRSDDNATSFSSVGFTNGPILSYIDTSVSSTGEYHYYVQGKTSDSETSSESDTVSIGIYGADINNVIRSNDISVYPNPTYETLNITSDDNITSLRLLNSYGKVINIETNKVRARYSINLRSLDSGAYVLVITTEDGQIAKRFIKM